MWQCQVGVTKIVHIFRGWGGGGSGGREREGPRERERPSAERGVKREALGRASAESEVCVLTYSATLMFMVLVILCMPFCILSVLFLFGWVGVFIWSYSEYTIYRITNACMSTHMHNKRCLKTCMNPNIVMKPQAMLEAKHCDEAPSTLF